MAEALHLTFTYHVNINCRDLERSQAFYEMLGFREVLDFGVLEGPDLETGLQVPGARCKSVMLRLGDEPRSCHIDLIEWLDPPSTTEPPPITALGPARVCFYSRDVEADYQTLVDAGVSVFSAPVTIEPDGAAGPAKAFCFQDPDGTILEMMQVFRRA